MTIVSALVAAALAVLLGTALPDSVVGGGPGFVQPSSVVGGGPGAPASDSVVGGGPG